MVFTSQVETSWRSVPALGHLSEDAQPPLTSLRGGAEPTPHGGKESRGRQGGTWWGPRQLEGPWREAKDPPFSEQQDSVPSSSINRISPKLPAPISSFSSKQPQHVAYSSPVKGVEAMGWPLFLAVYFSCSLTWVPAFGICSATSKHLPCCHLFPCPGTSHSRSSLLQTPDHTGSAPNALEELVSLCANRKPPETSLGDLAWALLFMPAPWDTSQAPSSNGATTTFSSCRAKGPLLFLALSQRKKRPHLPLNEN